MILFRPEQVELDSAVVKLFALTIALIGLVTGHFRLTSTTAQGKHDGSGIKQLIGTAGGRRETAT